ncbi:MAG: flagellar protein FliT [Ramlibacter sp.]|nr:flagellar protein FliT [Ramlibacter sp.]
MAPRWFRYVQLARTVARMVELARVKQWGQLATLDAQCASIIGQLRELEPEHLHAPDRVRLAKLAGRIRADQAELTALVRPQLLDLIGKMQELQRERLPATAAGAGKGRAVQRIA